MGIWRGVVIDDGPRSPMRALSMSRQQEEETMTLSTNSRNSFWLGLLVASGVTLSGANASAEEAKLKFYVDFIWRP